LVPELGWIERVTSVLPLEQQIGNIRTAKSVAPPPAEAQVRFPEPSLVRTPDALDEGNEVVAPFNFMILPDELT
jgi:hypothetical protein